MKTFGELKIGDRIYVYNKMKISYWIITEINGLTETSIDYTYDHKEVKRNKSFRFIKYKNLNGVENDIEFGENELGQYESKSRYGSYPIFSDRNAAIKYVTDLYDYRKAKLEKLQATYDRERSYIEKYKECLKNLPE